MIGNASIWTCNAILALSLAFPSGAVSQEYGERFPEVEQDRIGTMVLSGAAAGMAGIGLGWFAGRELTGSNEGGFLTAAALGSMAIPLGVHWGNGGSHRCSTGAARRKHLDSPECLSLDDGGERVCVRLQEFDPSAARLSGGGFRPRLSGVVYGARHGGGRKELHHH